MFRIHSDRPGGNDWYFGTQQECYADVFVGVCKIVRCIKDVALTHSLVFCAVLLCCYFLVYNGQIAL